MPKDAYYFPHDANARNDPKILALRSVYGTEGYGWFFMTIEILRDQENYRLPVNKYTFQIIAREIGCQPPAAEKFITDCIKEFADLAGSLLTTDGQYIWSESLLRRMAVIDGRREQAREAARLRWRNPILLPQHSVGNAVALREHSVGNASKVKESKVKESKVKDIIPKKSYGELKNVFLSDNEYQKLTARYNSRLPGMIDELSLGIAAKGYKYKSHYAAILNWERKRETEGKNGTGKRNPIALTPRDKYTRPEDA